VAVLVVVVGAAAVIVGTLAMRGAQQPQASTSTRAVTPVAPVAPPMVPMPSSQLVRCTQESAIAALPMRRRLAQLLMVGVDARGPREALAVVKSEQVGGIFLPGSATGLLSDAALEQVQAAAELPVAVAVDDEGGRVQRIDTLDGELPSARSMAANLSVEQVYQLAVKRGGQLRARGVTVDFAPSVDVSNQPDGAVIGDRSFSRDPNTVARYAGAFAKGLRDAGCVHPHWPSCRRSTCCPTGSCSMLSPLR
jgi:beta-N-acetylhexosaminidase